MNEQTAPWLVLGVVVGFVLANWHAKQQGPDCGACANFQGRGPSFQRTEIKSKGGC